MTKIKIFAFLLALFVPWAIASCFEADFRQQDEKMKTLPDGYTVEHNPLTAQFRFIAQNGDIGIWHFNKDLVVYMAAKHSTKMGNENENDD